MFKAKAYEYISKFRNTSKFDKYLGVPLSGKNIRRADFQYIIDHVATRLSNWKANSLLFVGQTILAKSVLEAISIYPMMTNLIPKSCIEEIQRVQRSFIWDDTSRNKKFQVVS